MSDQEWKTVRIRAELHARIESLAKAAERSTASYLEALAEAALVRVDGQVPNGIVAMREAIEEAEAVGAEKAAHILRMTVKSWAGAGKVSP